MIRVFIGYDSNEVAAYHTLCHSILKHASEPVSFAPVKLGMLRELYGRDREPSHSTEFSLSRFLVPHLAGYAGWAIFMDCDMMFRADIAELWALRDSKAAVQVVKHDYVPKSMTKMRGLPQIAYPKKNWSSLMLMNCGKCSDLTVEYVNEASGLALHQFMWCVGGEIGELPPTWNHLVGEYKFDKDAKNVHWTLGGPWWREYEDAPYAREWFALREEME